MSFDDIIYETSDGFATITIDPPRVLNALTVHTVHKLNPAFLLAWSWSSPTDVQSMRRCDRAARDVEIQRGIGA
jgi:1,4-dihydroxy-2-naphthoyl-CoA synthase